MSVGSRWYKFDFHNHTQASHDYAKPDITDREWLLAYMRQKVDCVVISDHNSGARIDSLKNELQLMARDAETCDLQDYRPLTLFPGVELTATGNVHILAVFHTESTGADVERLIGQCNNSFPVPREARNHELVLQTGPAGIIGLIRNNSDALCILAHIDARKGILESMTNQGELEAAFRAQPDAVEIRYDPAAIQNGTHKRLIENLPFLRGSDAHHPDNAGERTCWLKMSTPDFDGLRHALLDHENCVLFDLPPPEEPALQLRSLRLRTRLCKPANGDMASVAFSPFYNAIIGSRGSGKSTLIESIRLAMRKIEGLSSGQNKNLNRFRQLGQGMDTDSVIECMYRKDGADFRLSWRPDDVCTLYTLSEGEWIEESGWTSDRFPVSIFSQKMLYELASDNGAFLRVCDESPIVDKRMWTERHNELTRSFKNEQILLRGHQARRQSALSLTGQLNDAERAVSQLSQSAYYPVRQKLSQVESELSDAMASLNQHEEQIAALNSLVTISPPSEISDVSSHTLSAVLQSLADAKQGFDDAVADLINKSTLALNAIRSGEYFMTLERAVVNEKANVTREAESLRAQGLNPDTLDELMQRCERLRNELKEYEGLDAAVSASELRIKELIDDMVAHRMALTARRREFLSSLTLTGLDIKILPLCAPPETIVEEYQTLTGITSFGDRIYDGEVGGGLLHAFISNRPYNPLPAAAKLKYSLLDTLKNLHESIKNDDKDAGQDLHGAFRNRIKNLPDEALDSLRCWYPEDGISIRYRSPGGEMEDIASASPGQKGASMLQFLLSYGSDPLLIDQPEDDLDCLMLSQSVIPAIVANKKRRQLIIVSHSAPIVVNGDAEHVICMTYDRSGLQPGLSAGLQHKEMKDFICRQMEGGEKAFRSRFERILS